MRRCQRDNHGRWWLALGVVALVAGCGGSAVGDAAVVDDGDAGSAGEIGLDVAFDVAVMTDAADGGDHDSDDDGGDGGSDAPIDAGSALLPGADASATDGDDDGDNDGDNDGDDNDGDDGDDAADGAVDDGAALGDGASDDADASATADTPPADLPAPTTPIDPATLPLAAMVEANLDYGIDPLQPHQPCVAVADFDGNGRQDFVVVEAKGWSATIRAVLLGKGPPKHVQSKFNTVTLQANFGCTAVDMDADGHQDLLFGGFSGLALYKGDGKGAFVDVSAEWLPYLMDYETFTVVPADLDGDGDLDLFVGAGFAPPSCDALTCNYTNSDLLCSLQPPIPWLDNLQDRVLIRGPKLPLSDATAAWKVPGGGTQTVAAAMDVDSDGLVDILVADDFGSARILHNLGGSFATYATEVGIAPYSGAMGWAVGDFDGDGLPDLVIAESGPTPVYRNKGKGAGGLPFMFEDIGGALGTWAPNWTASSWSPLVADFDHDGGDDLWIANASNVTMEMAANPKLLCAISKESGIDALFAKVPGIDVLMLHQPSGGMAAHRIVHSKHAHIIIVDQRAIDLDDDGDLDVVQTRPGPTMMTSLVRILRNDLVKKGGSFRVRLQGKGGNLDALGARVRATIGGKVRTRWLYGSGAFGGTPARLAHFGLGAASEAVDVEVRWPDGQVSKLGKVAAGATVDVTWP